MTPRPTKPTSTRNGPVDLDALRRSTAPVIAWYERFLDGDPQSLASLDAALVGLRSLPPISGRLGRAVAVVAAGGRDASTEETIEALELLRSSVGLRRPGPVVPPAKSQRPPARRATIVQPPLPGLEDR